MHFLKVILRYSLKCTNFKIYNNLSKFTKENFYQRSFYKKPFIFKIYKMLRHAQTQHGDCRTEDNENIVVLQQNLLSIPRRTDDFDAINENKIETASQSTTSELEQTECVWFYKYNAGHEPESTNNEYYEKVQKSEIANDEIDKKSELTNDSKQSDNNMISTKLLKRECDGDIKKNCKKTKYENKANKLRQSGAIKERYEETSYYFENDLRKVYPYYFQFTTFTKGRWVGEKILDVFAREFRAQPAKEYERSIQAGTLSVNNEKVPIDYKLKHNDLLSNIVHRHEVPVTSQSITIVHMDNDILVVNKPASIPVHPCGRYRHNTVIFILAKEYNLKNLRTIHRLDRLTSGLLLFGRNSDKARLMTNQISNREVQKEYICQVDGEFPDDVIDCKEPIEVVSFKIGVCKVSAKGKECTTKFQKLYYNGKTSIVLCKPLTGRMHQIRVHLQYLGYPIVNDPLYNHEIFGPNKGRGGDIGGRTDSELIKDLINIHNAENWLGLDGDDSELGSLKRDIVELESITNNVLESESSGLSSCSKNLINCPAPNNTDVNTPETLTLLNSESKITVGTQTGHIAPDLCFNKDKLTTDKYCYECTVRYRDPRPQDLVMYLHAWKYKGPGWEYETELPDWAKFDN